MSGKGGVGKRTVAVSLAVSLARQGRKVGLLDADIHGPNIPKMLGLDNKRLQASEGGIIPEPAMENLSVVSMAFLLDNPDNPVVWRGPLKHTVIRQFVADVQWGDLDYLIIDLPPGTGDIQLTLAQKVPVSGSVIVTTPQDIALLDARKAVQMFRKVDMTVLGIVENMSTHICSQCGHEEPIFGSGGGSRMSEEYDVPLLGQLPLALKIREDLDRGMPTVVSEPESELTESFRDMARKTAARLSMTPRNLALNMPQINILNT